MRALITASVLALACTRSADRSEQMARAREFFAAANAGDSATLARMSVDAVPVQTALSANRAEPSLFRFAADSLEVDWASERSDTANYFFSVPRGGRIAVGFVRRNDTWLVRHIGFPDRM
jgi:hypothetical protein